jgi:hypothetical protein
MDESGLLPPPPEPYFAPSDVRRVSQIFEKPQFFIDGASSNDIIQGCGGGCYFLSALATMSTAAGLVEKFCVAVSWYGIFSGLGLFMVFIPAR